MSENGTAEYPVCWKGQLVGTIPELGQNDMWYFDAKWNPEATPLAQEFAKSIAHLVGKTFWSLEIEQFTWVEIPDLNMKCTIVHVPIDNRITFHLMINQKPPKSYL